MLTLLRRNGPLRTLVLGFTCAQLGMQIGWIGLIWWIANTARSPQLLGALFVAFQVPSMASAPFVGPLLDRGNAKRLTLACLAAGTLCVVVLTLFAFRNALGFPLLAALITVFALTSPASLTYRRMLVGHIMSEGELPAAYALFSLGAESAILAGPALGGLIVGKWSVAGALACFALGTAGYFVAIALTPQAAPARRSSTGFDPLHGARQIIARPVVLAVTLLSFFFFLAYGPLEVALPIAARTALHTNALGYGALWSAYAIGSVSGLFVMRAQYQRLPATSALCAIAVLWGVLAAGLAFTTSLAAAMVVLMAAGFLWSPYNALESAFMQVRIPLEVQGAVFSLQSPFLYTLSVPLGAMLAGFALTRFTAPEVIFASGISCAIVGLAGFAAFRRIARRAMLRAL